MVNLNIVTIKLNKILRIIGMVDSDSILNTNYVLHGIRNTVMNIFNRLMTPYKCSWCLSCIGPLVILLYLKPCNDALLNYRWHKIIPRNVSMKLRFPVFKLLPVSYFAVTFVKYWIICCHFFIYAYLFHREALLNTKIIALYWVNISNYFIWRTNIIGVVTAQGLLSKTIYLESYIFNGYDISLNFGLKFIVTIY